MNDHVRPCNSKPQQRDLTPVLLRPVELAFKSGQTRVRRNCPLRAIRRHSLAQLECPQSVVSRYLISTTGIAQHHAVAATHMDAFAEIIRSHARFSSNPDLITS